MLDKNKIQFEVNGKKIEKEEKEKDIPVDVFADRLVEIFLMQIQSQKKSRDRPIEDEE